MKRLLAALFAVLFVAAATGAYAANKIGLVNVAQVVRDSKAGQEAKSKVESEVASKRKVLEERDADIKKLQEELKREIKEDLKTKKAEKIEKSVKEINRMKTEYEDDLKQLDRKLTAALLKDIMDVAAKIGKEDGFSIIMERTPSVMYAEDSADITQKVIKRYDEETKTRKK